VRLIVHGGRGDRANADAMGSRLAGGAWISGPQRSEWFRVVNTEHAATLHPVQCAPPLLHDLPSARCQDVVLRAVVERASGVTLQRCPPAHPRARAARLGADAEQSRRCAPGAR